MITQKQPDYSKAAGFISEEEVGYMKKLTNDAKELLVSKTGADKITITAVKNLQK